MNRSESKYFSTAARMDEALIACLEKKDFAYVTVKEICEKAGVNRSTFYLHYETIADLLDECVEYTNRRCFQKYPPELTDIPRRLASGRPEDWNFLSPAYLRPYFEFVRENRRLYRVVLLHRDTFRTQQTFRQLFERVFSPALDHFHFPAQEKAYIVRFYLGGLTAVVQEWIARDCADEIDRMIALCMRCVLPDGTAAGWPDASGAQGEAGDG